MKEAGKKDAHKAMCQSSTDANNRRYGSMKNITKNAVSKTMREKAGERLTN